MSREKLTVVPPIELHSTVCDFEIIKKEIGGSGSEKSTYIHEQSVPAQVWKINHQLGAYPSVTVIDSLKRLIITEVNYIDENYIEIKFNQNITGKAFLN